MLGLALALGGCTGAVTASTEFNRTSPDGIVILGVLRKSALFERGNAVLRFVRVDRKRSLLIADTGKQANDFRIVRSGGRGVVDQVDRVNAEGDVEFFLYKVPPGEYYLYTVQWGDSGFQIMERGSFVGSVHAGKILYWGDLGVSQPEELLGDLRLELAGSEPEAAQRVLDQYPSVLGEMTVRPLEPAQLACDLGGEGSLFGEFLLADDSCYGGHI